MRPALKALLLIGLGLFLYSRFTGGTLFFYIHQRFGPLVLVASLGLILIAGSYLYAPRREERPAGPGRWLSLVLLALPMVLGLLVKPQPLGATAVGNREVNATNLTSPSRPAGGALFGGDGEKNILDWLIAFQESSDVATFAGQEAHISGFVYRDERFAGDTFLVGRFTVSCCVADASPVGLVVRWPEAASLADNQWVDVRGHFEPGLFDGEATPILVVDTLERIDPPRQPYLYL
jgi:putative membrane protein